MRVDNFNWPGPAPLLAKHPYCKSRRRVAVEVAEILPYRLPPVIIDR